MRVRRFKLSDSFIETYKDREVPWGPVGYVTYKRTYSRRLNEFNPGEEGTEEWYQTCRRVIEGMFSIQKKHIQSLGLAWNDAKAQRTAKDAYERMFVMKWLPPGRGLWMMGTDFVENRTAAGLFNCGFVSTKDIATRGGFPFQWAMDALMVGIGVGFDTLGAGTVVIKQPGSVSTPSNYYSEHLENRANEYHQTPEGMLCIIADTREGWAESVRVQLDSYFFGYNEVRFDYSKIRGPNQPISGFGGVSSGPDPLILLHLEIKELLSSRIGQLIRSTDIVDIKNLTGKCVVAGNVRRSAELAIGHRDDRDYLTMKNDTELLQHHRWASNNSYHAVVGMDYSWHAEQVQSRGEPGTIWLDNARNYGRMKDPPRDDDLLVMGFNPCVEQQLEHLELCCLVESFPAKHDSYEDYLQTLKITYLYGKTVTLCRTHWAETNGVMQKNRRIGLSQSGVVQAKHRFGLRTLLNWSNDAYEYIRKLDAIYSDWLCVPRSKRMTSIKPSGTVSLLNGSTPGIHYPEDEYYIRRIRFADTSELLPLLEQAGYHIEDCVYSPRTKVVSFPIKEDWFVRGKRDVSMWEQLELAAAYQHYWADNSVSVTVTFKEHEAKDISQALELFETRLKAVSFLKYEETGYKQAPYEPITKEEYESMTKWLEPIKTLNTSSAEEGQNANSFCDSGACTIDWSKLAQYDEADSAADAAAGEGD